MKRAALVSEDGVFRYWLTREWSPELGRAPRRLCFVMLNPSTADASGDDPTIRKCVGFARLAGFNVVAVANLFAFRATDPKTLVNEDARRNLDVVGPDNDFHIHCEMREADLVIAAWGAAETRSINARIAVVRAAADDLGKYLWCLGVTKSGAPRHPLMVAYKQPIERWFERGGA